MASSSEDGACGSSGVAIYKEVLRDIYCSEELKIEFKRYKKNSSTIDTLCTGENTTSFCAALFELVSKRNRTKEEGTEC